MRPIERGKKNELNKQKDTKSDYTLFEMLVVFLLFLLHLPNCNSKYFFSLLFKRMFSV